MICIRIIFKKSLYWRLIALIFLDYSALAKASAQYQINFSNNKPFTLKNSNNKVLNYVIYLCIKSTMYALSTNNTKKANKK